MGGVNQGAELKKEINTCNSLALDLPASNDLRGKLLELEDKFEKLLDWLLGSEK